MKASPAAARVAPFFIFLVLTTAQGKIGVHSAYWLYLVKTILGGWMLWALRRDLAEMRWAMSWEAVLTGVAVFLIWVGLDPYYPSLSALQGALFSGGGAEAGQAAAASEQAQQWNPIAAFGQSPLLAGLFIGVRLIGSSLVVPPLEEVFYRSFLYRWIATPNFLSVRLGEWRLGPFLITSLIFGLAHYQWLAGILCGLAYQGLVCRKNRLGDAMTAHAITNFLLGAWVLYNGDWHFW